MTLTYTQSRRCANALIAPRRRCWMPSVSSSKESKRSTHSVQPRNARQEGVYQCLLERFADTLVVVKATDGAAGRIGDLWIWPAVTRLSSGLGCPISGLSRNYQFVGSGC